LYLVSAHTRHGCDAILVVVTPSAKVAAWAASPIPIGHPGVSLVPIVVGPDAVPIVRDEAEAVGSPELALLSAMVHGRGAAADDIAKAAFAGMRDLDEERAALYSEIAIHSLRAAARTVLENLMGIETFEFTSDFWKRRIAKKVAEQVAERVAEARAESILAVLTARGVVVAREVRERVLACTDVALLDVWIARAANAQDAAEVVREAAEGTS
jgi:hypothetical protein